MYSKDSSKDKMIMSLNVFSSVCNMFIFSLCIEVRKYSDTLFNCNQLSDDVIMDCCKRNPVMTNFRSHDFRIFENVEYRIPILDVFSMCRS